MVAIQEIITLKTTLNLDDTDNSGGANTLILIADWNYRD